METQLDNSAPAVADNASPATSVASAAPTTAPSGGWKTTINTDLRNSPLLQKFEDTPEGLNKALESHANLEKLLGHEKVPIPKGIDDVDGWNRFSKAMGIPDKAEAYGLPDAAIPDSIKDMTLDKNKFSEIAHAHKLTPAQAKGLWETYVRENVSSYESARKAQQEQLNNTVNTLKGEWGDAYQSNVEMSQMVINKFSPDQETNDLMTSVVASDPRLIKAFAKIGEQFAENKVGEFQMKKFSLAPEEAMSEVEKIKNDMEGPYMNQTGKWSSREHQAAIDRVNSLIAAARRGSGQA